MSLNDTNLVRLIKLAESISDDPKLIAEMIEEIESKKTRILCNMIKQQFRKNLLNDLGFISDFVSYFFLHKKISEINLYDSAKLGIKCFFMAKDSMFPLHDHPNLLICTGIIYGEIKYIAMDPANTENWYTSSSKGSCKAGGVLFCTKKYRNIHSILAIEDTIMIDIFIPNYKCTDELNLFRVRRKIAKSFLLEKNSFEISS